MKTKIQKAKAVEEGLKNFKNSETIILADFTGLKVNDLNAFRKSLKAIGIVFRVLKKRLLKIIFEHEGIDFDVKKFGGQTGIVFSSKDLTETAGIAYKFSKEKEAFKILGGFNLKEKKFVGVDFIKQLGQLPSREVLLGQLVGMLAAPIRSFLYVLSQKSKMVEQK